jgi:hypothetical protein
VSETEQPGVEFPGSVQIRFEWRRPIPDDEWNCLRNWLQKGGLSPSSLENGSGLSTDLWFSQTFETEPDFRESIQRIVHEMRTAGYLPRDVHRVEATYRLKQVDRPILHQAREFWRVGIDL